MDSIHALEKVYDSLSKGASTLDFSPSDITGDCAAQVQEIVRERKSGNSLEKAISSALSCMNNGSGLAYLGHISAGMGYWTYSVRAYEKALHIFEKFGDMHHAAQIHNNLGSVYSRMGKWNKAIEYIEKCLESKEKLGDVQGTARAYNNLGLVYADMGKLPKAAELYQKSLETCEKIGDIKGAAQTYGNLGSVYSRMGEWNKAIELYQKILGTFEKLGDLQGAAQAYNNLGSVYSIVGEWNKAIEFHQKSLETCEKLGDVKGVAQTYGNLGSVYSRMSEWIKAIEFYQKSLETLEKFGDTQGAAKTYNNLGLVYADMGEWIKAIEFYRKSLETYEKLGYVHGASQTYGNLSSAYYRMGEWNKAIELYQESLGTFEKLGDILGASQMYNNLGLVYAGMGEWTKAIEFYQKSLVTKEKLGDIKGAANTYNNLGSVYHKMSELPKAIEFYQKSLKTSEKLGDIHGKGTTLMNLGKLHLDKKPPEPEEGRKYLEESVKLLNKEARPDYPNALNWLALCYHKLGAQKKREAKQDRKNQDELVKISSNFFSRASELYKDVARLPRVNLPSLKMYVHLDKGFSLSVMNVTEENDKNALKILDSALLEFRKALEFADEKEKIKLEGVISDHEAKKYIRLAAIEKNPDKQNQMLDKAIEALLNAASDFEKLEDKELCSKSTCEGCAHLFKGLKLFRNGVKAYNQSKTKTNIAFNASLDELEKARKCYEKAENELGEDTAKILNESFDYVEDLIRGKDEMFVTKASRKFNTIIEELSAVGLRKMVKMYTFDESMNVKKEESIGSSGNVNIENVHGSNIIITSGSVQAGDMNASSSDGKKDNKYSIPDAATLAGYFGWVAGGVLLYYGYNQSNIISIVGSILIFIFLVVWRLKKRR